MPFRSLHLPASLLALVALTSLLTLTSGRPFTGHFTLIRPNGETISHSYLGGPALSAHLQGVNKNSPTYYIKLAPSPYTYVPGLGYVSKPPVKNPFFSVNFPSNGKPAGLYSLSKLTAATPAPVSRADSPISWMKGRYMFNGRPKGGITAVRTPASTTLLNALLHRPAGRRSQSSFGSRRGKIAAMW